MMRVNIDPLIKVIENLKLIIWEKTWDALDTFVGVFIYSPLRRLRTLSANIVVEYNKETQECDLTVIGLGEKLESLVWNEEASIKNEIVKLAQRKGWAWREVNVETTMIQCPYCMVMLTPFELKIGGYGYIVCPDCGREFVLGDETVFGDVPVVIDSDLSRVECPVCHSVENYKEYHVSWDGTVSCLSCGKTIYLEEARRHPADSFEEE
ncbi:MAG: hypothetical protein ACFFE2_10245 [Candidatus Thorarchaeota archaeon]